MARRDRAAWLKEARDIYAEWFGEPGEALTVTIEDASGRSISLSVSAAVRALVSARLSEREAEIVRVVGTGALKGETIARRLGVSHDGTLKTLLSNLVARGVLETTPEGYRVQSDRSD